MGWYVSISLFRGAPISILRKPYQDLVSLQVGALNRLLERADAFCLHDETCPFFGKGKGSVLAVNFQPPLSSANITDETCQAFDTLLAKAIAAPLPAPGCGPTGNPFCKDPVTATDLRFGVHAFFRSNPDFPAFNRALNASLNGDATGFAYIALQDVRQSVVGPLLCSDFREFTIICSMKVVTLIRPVFVTQRCRISRAGRASIISAWAHGLSVLSQ
jgi:hypothetical protein